MPSAALPSLHASSACLVGLTLPACRAHAASERNRMSRPQEPRFQFLGSLRACRDGTDGTAMRKGAASTGGSGSTTPAQRNLLSARPNSDLAATELQKDGSGLQGGCFPPARRRSDRCHRQRGRTTELGPRSTSTAATDGHWFLLPPATVAPAHSVQHGRRRSPCFASSVFLVSAEPRGSPLGLSSCHMTLALASISIRRNLAEPRNKI
jgi:hypothetical protein